MRLTTTMIAAVLMLAVHGTADAVVLNYGVRATGLTGSDAAFEALGIAPDTDVMHLYYSLDTSGPYRELDLDPVHNYAYLSYRSIQVDVGGRTFIGRGSDFGPYGWEVDEENHIFIHVWWSYDDPVDSYADPYDAFRLTNDMGVELGARGEKLALFGAYYPSASTLNSLDEVYFNFLGLSGTDVTFFEGLPPSRVSAVPLPAGRAAGAMRPSRARGPRTPAQPRRSLVVKPKQKSPGQEHAATVQSALFAA